MTAQPPSTSETQQRVDARTRRGRWQMLLLLLACASPVIASYVTFYIIKPTGGKTNYGELVYPVQEAPKDSLSPMIYGKWTLLLARPAATCEQDEQNCLRLLHMMRQVRAALGKEKNRLQVVWLITDDGVVSDKFKAAYDEDVAGVKMIRLPKDATQRQEVENWLALDQASQKIQLIDPTAAKMMRFPVEQNAPEFKKMLKDVEKLLKWNPTGKYGQ
mgnify:FL=1